MHRFAAVCLLALSACGGGIERVSFVTDALAYGPDSRVGLSLTNVSGTVVSVNLCLSQLVSADGKTTGPSEAAQCADLEPAPLEPGDSIDSRKTIPTKLAVGRWRYATTIRLKNGASEKVVTPEFDVVP